FPAAVFGAGGPSGSNLLGRADDFPPEAEEAVRDLAGRFRWKAPPDGSRLSPCFAAWPAAGGRLVVRFADAGCDAFGRPHSVRIEAAWVAGDVTGAGAGYLTDAAW